jgi:predicted metal-dependent hydrolase
MHQLSLAFTLDEKSLERHLEKSLKRNIFLVITDNSTHMISAKATGRSMTVRLHKIFLNSSRDVIDEIIAFLAGKNKKTPLTRHYIRENSHRLIKKPRKKVNPVTQGKHYNLLEFFHAINSEYFEGRISAEITWGCKAAKYSVKRRTLGSYSADAGIIRIHPILDSKKIPKYFLEFVVYHEMLHADLGIETDKGRRSVHPAEFRKREKLFKHYERARNWEKKRW